MADVSDSDTGRLGGARSRAQLFLVGALALAVVFITLAVLLNTAIYTENLATRSDGVGTTDLIEYQGAAAGHADATMRSVNRRNNTTYAALEANYSESVGTWSDLVSTHKAAHSHVVATTVEGTTRGARIVQDTNRSFTDRSGVPDWELAADANARAFSLEVDRASLNRTDAGNLTSDAPFTVAVTENGSTYHTYVYRDSTDTNRINVTVTEPGGNVLGTCSAATSRARLDVTDARFVGDACAPLSFLADLDGGYDIAYEDGANAEGVYRLVVDRPYGEVRDGGTHYHAVGGGSSPVLARALYAANVSISYRTPEAYYQSEFRVAPGEAGETAAVNVSGSPTGGAAGASRVAFAQSGALKTGTSDGGVTDYTIDDASATGPGRSDVDGDGSLDVPVGNASGLHITDADGDTTTLVASGVEVGKTRYAVGTWDGSDTSVFYADDSGDAVYRVDESGTSTQVFDPGNGASAVLGIADVTGDGSEEIVFVDASATMRFYESDGTTTSIGGFGSNVGLGVGSPADFDGDGTARVPIIDGSNNVALVDGSGTTTTLTSGGPAAKAPTATVDWDGDGDLEVLFLDTGGNLRYLDDVTGTNDVQDVYGGTTVADEEAGVA
jgi:hypothetical protein